MPTAPKPHNFAARVYCGDQTVSPSSLSIECDKTDFYIVDGAGFTIAEGFASYLEAQAYVQEIEAEYNRIMADFEADLKQELQQLDRGGR